MTGPSLYNKHFLPMPAHKSPHSPCLKSYPFPFLSSGWYISLNCPATFELKPEKSAFMLPVTTRTNKQRQGLNLYRCFIQMVSDLRRRWVIDPKRPSYISFQTNCFYKEKKSVGKKFEFRGKKKK